MIKQGNSRRCFVCGFENPAGLHLHFYQTAPGEVSARVQLSDQFQGWQGVAHGGILATMLDEAAGRAYLNGSQLDQLLFTAKLSVRYRKPAPLGIELVVRGKAGEERRGVKFATSEITDLDGNVYAEAEAYLTDIPAEMLSGWTLDPAEWQVIPEEGAVQ